MWTRALLKNNAKNALRRYYWSAFLLCLVITLVCNGGTGGMGVTVNVDAEAIRQFVHHMDWRLLLPLLAGAFSVSVIGLVFEVFVGNVLTVGSAEFFLVSRESGCAAPIEAVLKGFHSDYLKVVLTLFLRHLYIFLWSLLFVIPGIVKSYEYRMMPYILADYPEMTKEQVFAESRRLMTGHKMEAFVLDLSFLGWEILGALCCGVGIYFVLPYIEATYAEFYTALKETV